MKQIRAAAFAALALACGGDYDSYDEPIAWDYVTDDTEFGQLEQSYSSQISTSGSTRLLTGVQGQTGILTQACNSQQSSAAICALPTDKHVDVVTLNLGCSTNEYTRFQQDTFAILNELALAHLSGSGWTFSVNAVSSNQTLTLVCDPASGAGGTHINGYVTVYPVGQINALSEPYDGWWVTTTPNPFFGEMVATIHYHDLYALGTNARRHGVAQPILMALGNGQNNWYQGGAHATQTTLSTTASVALFSPGELCRTRNYVTGGSSFAVSASAQCPNY